MTEFANSFAQSILASQKDALVAMPPEQRKPYAVQILLKAKQNPVFNQSGLDVSQETAATMQKLEAKRESEKENFRMRGFSEKAIEGLVEPDLRDARRNAKLEGMGIITNRDLPAGDWKLGFGADKVQDLSNVLSQHYGVPVAVGKSGDDIVYLDPKEKKLVKANFGAIAAAGQAIPMVADVAATIAAGTAGSVAGTVAKETLFSGAGTTAGEALRLGIGKAMGVHDLEWGEIGTRSLKVGGEAAAFTGGIGGVIATAKGASNFIKGGIFNRDEAAKYGLSVEEADQVISEVNNILKQGGKDSQVKATLAQKADDVNVASAEAQLKASQEHGQRFAERGKADQAASAEALDVISAPPVTVEKGMPDVSTIARQKVAARGQKVERLAAKNVAELKAQMDEIGRVQKETVGAPTADYFKLQHDVSKQAKDTAWDDVKRLGGYDEASKLYNIEIPYGEESKRLKKIFKRRGETVQYQGAARGARGAYVPPKTGKDLKPDAVTNVEDLADLNHEISVLRSDISAANLGKGKTPTQVAELIEMKDAFVADRNIALIKAGRKDIIKAIDDAEALTAQYHSTYKRSAVGDLMQKSESGVPVIKSKDFVDDMLKRDEVEVEQLLDVIADNPALMQQWKEGLADTWKQKAFSATGKFNGETSKRWFKDNEAMLGWFFEPAELRKFQKTGVFANKVAESSARLEKFKNRANAKWGSGVLSRADPEGMTNLITGKGGSWSTPKGYGVKERISKIKYIKNMTAEHPRAWTAVKNDFKRHIRNDILDPKTGRIAPNKIAGWIEGEGNKRVIVETLGERYYKDLSSINDVIKIINKKENRVTASQEVKGIIQAVRAGVAPPLTRRGRAFTAGITFYNANSQKRIADAILDEKSIRKVANLAEHSAHTRRFYEKAFSLGFALPDEDEE